MALSAKLHPAAIIYFNFQLLWCIMLYVLVHTVEESLSTFVSVSVSEFGQLYKGLFVAEPSLCSFPVISNFSALTLHCSSYYFISYSRSPFPLQKFMRNLRRKPRCLIFPLILAAATSLLTHKLWLSHFCTHKHLYLPSAPIITALINCMIQTILHNNPTQKCHWMHPPHALIPWQFRKLPHLACI